ncbi:MAG: hypothetical protein WC376_04460 [Candidatus Nanoarchaeia archaeon]|jgi:hypothetical protein
MTNNKSQEMSIQTVVVLILIMIVLVVVIAFAVPQLTGMFGGLSQLSNSTSSQINTDIDLNPKACYSVTPLPSDCALQAACASVHNEQDCLAVKTTAATDAIVGPPAIPAYPVGSNCCTWRNTN